MSSCSSWIPAFAGTVFLLVAVPLHAEEHAAKPDLRRITPPHKPVAELRMDESVCQQLVQHVPDADVAYQPGVSVDGRRVARADINPSPINKTIERQIAIKIYNDAAQTFGLPMPGYQKPSGVPGEPPETVPLAAAETDIGYVTFRNGKAYLNNRPLDNRQQDELAVLCIQREKR